jgi:hypothetical protein
MQVLTTTFTLPSTSAANLAETAQITEKSKTSFGRMLTAVSNHARTLSSAVSKLFARSACHEMFQDVSGRITNIDLSSEFAASAKVDPRQPPKDSWLHHDYIRKRDLRDALTFEAPQGARTLTQPMGTLSVNEDPTYIYYGEDIDSYATISAGSSSQDCSSIDSSSIDLSNDSEGTDASEYEYLPVFHFSRGMMVSNNSETIALSNVLSSNSQQDGITSDQRWGNQQAQNSFGTPHPFSLTSNPNQQDRHRFKITDTSF